MSGDGKSSETKSFVLKKTKKQNADSAAHASDVMCHMEALVPLQAAAIFPFHPSLME